MVNGVSVDMSGFRDRFFWGALGLCAGLSLPLSAGAQTADELYERLLSDPDNAELNLKFGKAAEREGNPRHALAAYERASRGSPDNAEAYRAYERQRMLLSPPITSIEASFGATYSSNVRQAADRFDQPSDGALGLDLALQDRRTVGPVRLRTLGAINAEFHGDETDLNDIKAKIWTGPLVRPAEDIELHFAGGGGLRHFDDGLLYTEGSLRAEVAFLGDEPPQLITLYAGYRNVDEAAGTSRRDGYFINLAGRFSRLNIAVPGDGVFVQPLIGFSNGDEPNPKLAGFNAAETVRDAIDYGARVAYFRPIVKGVVTGGVGARLHQTQFRQSLPSSGKDRRDTRLEGTAHLIFDDLIEDNIDLRFDYRFEHNDSNDSDEDFDNHVLSSRIVWKF